jgi:sugar phosphate permease
MRETLLEGQPIPPSRSQEIEQQVKIPRKRWIRIIPVAFIMYTIAFIDRTNLSLALPAMSRDLRMSAPQAAHAAGIFFWGYLLLQIPGGYLAQRWSAKRLISVLLIAWGVFAIFSGFVASWLELSAVRFLLGVAEGGVYPATLILLSNWFPRSERARANAYWLLCLPLSVVVSSPLSGWILDHWNWRVMLIAEGLLPFLWLTPWIFFIDDTPQQARWIAEAEQSYIERRLASERSQALPQQRSLLHTFLDWQILLLSTIYFLFISAQFAYVFWLSSAIGVVRQMSNLRLGMLFSIPFLLGGLAMVTNSWHSDIRQERRKHIAAALALGGASLLCGVLASQSLPILAYGLVSFAAVGYFGSLGPFWALPSEILPRNAVGSAMGLINAVGNLGGYFGPVFVGYIVSSTSSFRLGFIIVGICILLSSILCFLISGKSSSQVLPVV